jgi:hypothetical protein
MPTSHIGRYRVLRELGRGRGAAVFQGRDPDSGKQVAIKVFFARLTGGEDFAARFEETLGALQRLEHPYLVPVLDHGLETSEDDGGEQAYYVVTQYMPGGSLAERLDGRALLLAEVVPILQRLAEALDAAHTAGLVHGGVNPDQVLFDIRNRAYLADLGLNALLRPPPATGTLPLPGMPDSLPSGTPAYLSPEQIRGQALDGRADVYALGVILYEMLTGSQPFQADSTADLLRLHLEAPVPALSASDLARLVLPPAFNHVMERALAKDRDERYPTAGLLAQAVRTTFLTAAEEPARVEAPAAPAQPEPSTAEEGTAAPAGAPAEAVPAPAEAADGAPPAAPAPAQTPAAAPEPSEPQRPTMHVVPLDSSETPAMIEVAREGEGAGRAPFPWRELGGAGIVLLLVVLVLWRWPDVRGVFVPPTATATATATDTPTATLPPTATPSDTPTPAPTATASDTATAAPTATRTGTPSRTFTPRATSTPAATGTATATTAPTQPAATVTLSAAPLPTLAGTDTPPAPSDTPEPTPTSGG